jgi:hypothetical protein
MANLADIDRGTKYSITGTYTDDDGTAVDITNSEIFFTVKSTKYDTDTDDSEATIKKDGVIVSGTDGTYSITLTPTDTTVTPGKYFYSITIDVTGDDSDVKLLASGRVKVIGHPTNRVS